MSAPSSCAAPVDRVARCVVARSRREEYEYVRRGTANVYCIVELHAGRHLTHATRDRKTPRFVGAPQRLARRYRRATTIHLILDNLNLHGRAAVIGVLGPTRGAALWARFTPHYPEARELV